MRPTGLNVTGSRIVTSSPALLVTYSFALALAGSAAGRRAGRESRAARARQRRVTAGLLERRASHAPRVADGRRSASADRGRDAPARASIALAGASRPG